MSNSMILDILDGDMVEVELMQEGIVHQIQAHAVQVDREKTGYAHPHSMNPDVVAAC